MFQVGLKLYMFVPAIVAGSLLSISFWILAMIILRTYGLCTAKLFPKEKNQDLEMCPSKEGKEKCQKDSSPALRSKEFSVISVVYQCPILRFISNDIIWDGYFSITEICQYHIVDGGVFNFN